MVVTAVSSSFVAKAKSAMPDIRQATAGSADAIPELEVVSRDGWERDD
jgi:hypothetical protein